MVVSIRSTHPAFSYISSEFSFHTVTDARAFGAAFERVVDFPRKTKNSQNVDQKKQDVRSVKHVDGIHR